MKNSTAYPPPKAETNALHILTDIALFKESEDPADAKRAERLFEQLLEAYGPRLRAMAKGLLPFNGATSRFDTDDLYAALTLKIWQNADKFNPNSSCPIEIEKRFIGWSSRILKNHVNDILSAIQLEGSLIEYIDEVQWDEFAEKVPEESERAVILSEILDQMPPDEAELIRWYIAANQFDGSQLRTTAEERAEFSRKLNVTPLTLRKRRQRALQSLREQIEERMEDLS